MEYVLVLLFFYMHKCAFSIVLFYLKQNIFIAYETVNLILQKIEKNQQQTLVHSKSLSKLRAKDQSLQHSDE